MRSATLFFTVLFAAAPALGQPYGDLVLASDFNATGGFSRQCQNDGAGQFACDLIATNADRWRAQGVAAADFDGDGDDDAVFAVAEGGGLSPANQLCINNGGGVFACSVLSADLDNSRDVSAADFDGDGDVDLAFANTGPDGVGGVNRVCLNDGAAAFACADVSGDVDESNTVEAADLDGDGDTDLVFGNEGAGLNGAINRLCLNSGAGQFTCADLDATVRATTGFDAADLDGDGDLDLAVANFLGPDGVCLNSGSAAFTCADLSADGGDSYDVAAADFDGDGDLDLVIANAISNDSSRRNSLCFNSGAGTFTCAPLDDETDHSRGVVVADFDADGDTDVFFANERLFTFGPGTGLEQLCRNNGAGQFTCSYFADPNDDTIDVALGNFGGTPIPIEPGVETPSGFSLSAAYPNPFNPSTMFTLSQATAQAVTVSVFDALGRQVATLQDGVLVAGTHTLHFEADGLPSGVYLVRAVSPSGVVTRRVTLLR